MNDKKASDDEFFEDSSDEEFDFGEESFDMPTRGKSSSPKKGPGKAILFLVLFLMLGGAGYFGYQFYGKEKIKMPSLMSQASTKLEEKLGTKLEKREQEAKIKEEKKQRQAKLQQEKLEQERLQQAKVQQEKLQQEQLQQAKLQQEKLQQEQMQQAKLQQEKIQPTPTPAIPTATTAVSVTETPKLPLQAAATPPTPTSPATAAAPSTTATPSAQTITTPAVPALAATAPSPSAISASELQKVLEGQKKPQGASAPEQPLPATPQQPGATAQALQQASQTSQKPEMATLPEKNITIQEMQKDLFAPTPPTKPGATTPTPSPVPVSPPAVAESQHLKDMKEQLNETMDSLTRVNQQMENNLNQIKNLDAYTREVSQTVTKLNTDISAMDNRVLALTKTASSLSKEIGGTQGEGGIIKNERAERAVKRAPMEELEISTAPRRRIESTSVLIEEPEYVVHAVIPGRAWLKSSKGQIITVTEGDSLGNYGKILVIDAASGVVLTSSGITFR